MTKEARQIIKGILPERVKVISIQVDDYGAFGWAGSVTYKDLTTRVVDTMACSYDPNENPPIKLTSRSIVDRMLGL